MVILKELAAMIHPFVPSVRSMKGWNISYLNVFDMIHSVEILVGLLDNLVFHLRSITC